MNAHAKFAQMRSDMNAALIERTAEIDLCLTALVARQHVLLVGPPGTAKSMLAESLVRWLAGQQFTILLTKFTTPEEVFGPISLAGLKADHYKRITTGRLPNADIAFVDEVFKASSAILNTMLTVLNEGLFDNDGSRQSCPLQLCVAASNEWPGANGDGKELGALFDRFVLRTTVRPIATDRGLNKLLWERHLDVCLSDVITPQEIEEARTEAEALPWTELARDAYMAIIREARQEGICPGDRRLRKSIATARAYAWLNGHAQVAPDDLEILAHVLWDDPTEQPAKLAQIVGRIANPEGMRVNSLLVEAQEVVSATNLRDLAETASACKKLDEILSQLRTLTTTRATDAADYVKAEARRIRAAAMEAL
jgi:MoxR-like ATPase